MEYYIRAEDLCVGYVGPFASREDAERHVAFCEGRGDADPGKVVTEIDPADGEVLLLTWEEDLRQSFE